MDTEEVKKQFEDLTKQGLSPEDAASKMVMAAKDSEWLAILNIVLEIVNNTPTR